MSFGWSTGDIFAAFQLLNKVRIALKDSGGSRTDYQDDTAFIGELSTTLRTLHSIHITSSHPELLQDICDHVERLRREIDLFLNTIQNDYGDSLGPFSTSSGATILQHKVQYGMSTSKRVQSLRAKIGPELSTLQIKLTNHMLLVFAKLPSDIQRQMEHTTKAALESYSHNPEVRNVLQTFESQGMKLDGCLEQTFKILCNLEVVHTEIQAQDLQRRQERVASNESEFQPSAMQVAQNTIAENSRDMDSLSSIIQGSQQVAVGLVSILRAVVCILSLAIMSGYQATVLPLVKQLDLILAQPSTRGIKLIDALGRRATLPYDCGRTWAIFEKTIEVWFQGYPGEDLVRKGMYYVADAKHPSTFLTEESWSEFVKDGATVQMSVVTKNCTDCGGKISSNHASKHDVW
ncbi:hypothetical protein CSPX01_16038 [Colletotrichum filicis]|nr:hypothetical protein CSPX01_16038 [Colletotrichum filicis]